MVAYSHYSQQKKKTHNLRDKNKHVVAVRPIAASLSSCVILQHPWLSVHVLKEGGQGKTGGNPEVLSAEPKRHPEERAHSSSSRHASEHPQNNLLSEVIVGVPLDDHVMCTWVRGEPHYSQVWTTQCKFNGTEARFPNVTDYITDSEIQC